MPAIRMARPVKISVKTIIIAVFSIPPSGVTLNSIAEAQAESKKTEITGKNTLRAYNAKENDTIRPTITTLDMSATMATIK